MSSTVDIFEVQNYYLSLVALYGNYDPVVFNGRLRLRTYYEDDSKTSVDIEKTSKYFVDTAFYEANKMIRARENESFDEPRNLVVEPSTLLGEPYYMVYNTRAFPSKKGNTISMLSDAETQIRGLALIIKKDEKGQYTWLTTDEAHSIQNQLKAMY